MSVAANMFLHAANVLALENVVYVVQTHLLSGCPLQLQIKTSILKKNTQVTGEPKESKESKKNFIGLPLVALGN